MENLLNTCSIILNKFDFINVKHNLITTNRRTGKGQNPSFAVKCRLKAQSAEFAQSSYDEVASQTYSSR